MQIGRIILAAATTAVVGSSAASVPRQGTTISDTHLANFRTWGAPGCSADNQGEYNFELFDLNICFQFPASIDAESVMVENIATGDDVVCNVYVFTDESCTAGEAVLPAVHTCYSYNATAGADAGLGSYKTVCSDS